MIKPREFERALIRKLGTMPLRIVIVACSKAWFCRTRRPNNISSVFMCLLFPLVSFQKHLLQFASFARRVENISEHPHRKLLRKKLLFLSTFTKNCSSYTHNCGAFFNSYTIIIRHTHRKMLP